MSLKHAHSFSRGLTRAACIATVVGLSAFGLAASANAATTHFGPIPGSPVSVGSKPVAAAFDTNVTSGHQHVFIANEVDQSVSVIDAATHVVTATIDLGRFGSPTALAINQRADLVFVTIDDGTVLIIDGKTDSAISSGNPVGDEPDAVAWDPANDLMYVANYGDGTFTIIDDMTATKVHFDPTVTVGTGGTTSRPEGIAVDPVNGKIIVAAQGDDAVFVYDTAAPTTFVQLVGTFDSPNAVSIDSSRHRAYIANFDNNTVSVFNTTTSSEISGSPVAVSANPNALAIDPADGTVYVANFNDPVLSVIDPSSFSVTEAGPVGAKPSGVAVGVAGEVYVTNQKDANVSILGTTVSPTITSGAPGPATVGTAYSFPFTATGTPDAITFSVTGSVPPGVSLVDGSLVGTPTQNGDFTFTLHASNGVDPDATAQYTLHVDEAAVTPTPTPTSTPPAPTPTTPGGHLPQVDG